MTKMILFGILNSGHWDLFGIWYHFSLLKNEFQKPKKLKESS
jgi:hypothetical protein